jgi:hypothetical protein
VLSHRGIQGWVARGVPGGGQVAIDLDPGVPAGYKHDEFARQSVARVRLTNRGQHEWIGPGTGSLPFGQLDAVTASEVLRDLTMLATD